MLNYRGLKAVREHLSVTDAQLDRQIEAILQSQMKIVPVTGRAAQADDELVLDYAGEIGGEYFKGGTAERQTLVLGSNTFIPGFEAQLIGCNTGDEVDVKVTFPEKYHAAELAGKEAVFHCKIHEIRLKEKYKPDDEFAKAVGGANSFEEFKDQLRAGMQEYIDAQADAEVKENLLDQVCDGADFDISEQQIENALDFEIQSLANRLARQGLNMEMYLQFTQSTPEKLREEYRGIARRNVARQLAVMEIAEIENIAADEASVIEALEALCAENNLTAAQLKEQLDENVQVAIEQSVIAKKVLELLCEINEITVVEKD